MQKASVTQYAQGKSNKQQIKPEKQKANDDIERIHERFTIGHYPSTADVMKERLLDACVAVALDKGIALLKVKDVVEYSGVSRQSVYNHYSNKKQLLNDAFIREGLRLAEACSRELDKYPGLEDKFIQGFLYVYQNLPLNPLLKEVVQSNREFFSYVDQENYSPKAFSYLCLQSVFEAYPQLSEDLSELTEYWARGVFSLLMLPSEDTSTLELVEYYVRKRLIPGLALHTYQSKP